MQVFTSKRNTSNRKIYPIYANTRQHLYCSIVSPDRRLPTSICTINPNKKKKYRKGVATSLERVDPQRDRFSRVPPAWGTELVPTRARVDRSRRSGLRPSSPQHATPPRPGSPRASQAPHRTPSLLRELAENHTLRQLRPNSLGLHTLRTQTLSFSTSAFLTRPSWTAPRPLLTCGLFGKQPLKHTSTQHCAPLSSGRVRSVSANRERTRCPSPGLSSLWKQADQEDALLPLREKQAGQGDALLLLRDSRGRFGGTSRRAPENQADTEP